MTLSNAPSSTTPTSIPNCFSSRSRSHLDSKTGKNSGNLTLKYDLLTLKMTSGAIENDSIELAVLKNPDIDTEIISLALLEVTLAQDSS